MRRLLGSAAVLMRLAAVLCLGLLAAATPGRAEQAGPDGFSICRFANSAAGVLQSIIGPCQQLTDQTIESFGLSAGQAAIVARLQSLAANPSFNPLQRVVNATSLAAPRQFAAAGNYSDYWLPDVTDPANVELGVHMRYLVEGTKPQLYQMTYAVDGREGHFTVLWNRSWRRRADNS